MAELVDHSAHEVDERRWAAWRLLLHTAHPHRAGQGDAAALRMQVARDHVEQRRLAGAIPAHEADPAPFRQRHGGLVKQDARPEPIGQIVDVKHGRYVA